MASSDSPLFRNASKTLRDAARKEFLRTQMGQLVDQAQRELRYGATNIVVQRPRLPTRPTS